MRPPRGRDSASAGPAAGLLAGLRLCGSSLRPLAIDVGRLWKGFPASIAHLAGELCTRLGQPQAFGASDVPLIPGVATVSEIMLALEHDIDCLKFFPAEASGGAPALRAFAGPLPQVSFCPTGGVGLHNIADYLALPSVLTVGGSWLTPAEMLEDGDWEGVRRLAEEASDRVRAIRGVA